MILFSCHVHDVKEGSVGGHHQGKVVVLSSGLANPNDVGHVNLHIGAKNCSTILTRVVCTTLLQSSIQMWAPLRILVLAPRRSGGKRCPLAPRAVAPLNYLTTTMIFIGDFKVTFKLESHFASLSINH